jgi:hypothetical protein
MRIEAVRDYQRGRGFPPAEAGQVYEEEDGLAIQLIQMGHARRVAEGEDGPPDGLGLQHHQDPMPRHEPGPELRRRKL